MTTATQTEPQTVTFISQRRNLIIWHTPSYRKQTDLGNGIEVPGKFVEFNDGRLDVNETLAKRVGLTVDEILEWLRSHILLDDNHAGFFELQPPPPAPDDAIQAIALAGVSLDADKVRTILDAEREGHQRDLVIVTAERTLEHIAAAQAALAANGGGEPPHPANPDEVAAVERDGKGGGKGGAK